MSKTPQIPLASPFPHHCSVVVLQHGNEAIALWLACSAVNNADRDLAAELSPRTAGKRAGLSFDSQEIGSIRLEGRNIYPFPTVGSLQVEPLTLGNSAAKEKATDRTTHTRKLLTS